MTDDQIAEIWNLFKNYLDKKQIDLAAEKYVDLLADYGTDDIVLKEVLGTDRYLDSAIQYYLELGADDEDDDFEDD